MGRTRAIARRVMFAPSERWLDQFASVVHATMRRAGATRNSCVEAACVGVGVAREFGYLAEPMPVTVQAIAGKQATVVPGPGSKRLDGFAGHLILHFPAADALVDLTADQFHDPGRGLLVPEPAWFFVTRDELAEGVGASLPGGTTIAYREMVGDVSWRTVPAWTGPSTLTTALAVRTLRIALDRSTVRR